MPPRNHRPPTPVFVHVEEPYKPSARWVACEACYKTRKADELWRFPCVPRRPMGTHC
jgi:hypothetical protein